MKGLKQGGAVAAKKKTAQAKDTTANLGGTPQGGNASHRWVQQLQAGRGIFAGQAACGLGVA